MMYVCNELVSNRMTVIFIGTGRMSSSVCCTPYNVGTIVNNIVVVIV